MWLRFETGFLGGVEGAIEDVYAALGIRFIAIGPVWSKSRADFLDVVRGRRLAIEIPSSKLNTHDWSPSLPLVPMDSSVLSLLLLQQASCGSLQCQLRLTGSFQVYDSQGVLSEPTFDVNRTHQGDHGDFLASPPFLQSSKQACRINNSERTADHVLG